jgi:DNA repair protein RadC
MKTDEKYLPSDPETRPFYNSRVALPYLNDIRNEKQEHIICIALDVRNCFIAKDVIFKGTLNSSIIHPREIYRFALEQAAASIIIAHNHPSGEPIPSGADIDVTHQIAQAGQIMGIKLKDHIIMGKKTHFSFLEQGMLIAIDLDGNFELKTSVN